MLQPGSATAPWKRNSCLEAQQLSVAEFLCHEVSGQNIVTRDMLGSFQAIGGLSWPYDGPVGEEISAKAILGLV